MAWGALYPIKKMMYKACVQSVLTNGTENLPGESSRAYNGEVDVWSVFKG